MINNSDYFGRISFAANKVNDKVSAKDILDNMAKKDRSVNLVCGQVQSGKTQFILDLVNLAYKEYGYKFVIFLCGTTNNLKEQSVNRVYSHENINVEIIDKLGEFIKQNQSIENKKILFSILKSVTNLEQMLEILSSYGLNNKKILLIDDECDYASINTNDKYNPTRVNELITNIYNEINEGGFVQITATPYSNILNSKSTQIDCIYPLKAPNEYAGISFFNKLPNFYITNFENKFQKTLKISLNNEDLIILYSIFQWIYQTYNFFLHNQNEKSALLIYLSSEKCEHDTYKNSVKEFIENFHVFYKDSFKQWLLDDKGINDEEMIDAMSNLIQDTDLYNSIYVLNSDTDSNIKEINEKKMAIVIGGVMLSRGITYENLLTESFWCAAKNEIACDTLLQRCRWFGYRRKNDRYKYMNLITTSEIKDCMFEAEKLNDCLFDESGKQLSFIKAYETIKECESKLNIKATYEYKK